MMSFGGSGGAPPEGCHAMPRIGLAVVLALQLALSAAEALGRADEMIE
jgi:hypothetical protein